MATATAAAAAVAIVLLIDAPHYILAVYSFIVIVAVVVAVDEGLNAWFDAMSVLWALLFACLLCVKVYGAAFWAWHGMALAFVFNFVVRRRTKDPSLLKIAMPAMPCHVMPCHAGNKVFSVYSSCVTAAEIPK